MALQHLIGRGLVSPRVAKRYGFDSTSADGRSLSRDEASPRSRGEVPSNELEHPTNQGGSATHGRRVSAGGGAGRERGERSSHINDARNKRAFPSETRMSSRNRDQHWLTKYASPARAKASSDSEFYSDEASLYGGKHSRQER
jgi:hypothetical protein